MAKTIHVEAARIPDRDRLLRTLIEHGHDAVPLDEVGIVVHQETSDPQMTREIYQHIEGDVMALSSAFVPVKHDGVIYLRPAVG